MILFKKLDAQAIIPARATEGAAGFDLYSLGSVTIWPNEQRLVSTGIAAAIPCGYCGQIWPRSGLAVKAQIDRRAGLIDEDYRGEIKVLLRNEGDKPLDIEHGERIAQLVVTVYMASAMEVKELTPSVRGSGGFGSTGVNSVISGDN